jgi:hypothetical protein
MTSRVKPALLAGALAVVAAGGTTKSSSQDAAAVQTCLYMGEVRRTTILDDNNILFYMRNGTVYQNRLRNTCFMLHSTNLFTYGSSVMRRLCAGDIISVLSDSSFGGAPFPMATCNIGNYVPIDKDVADDLVATSTGKKTKDSGKRQVMKTEPVELPPATQPAEPAAPPASAPALPSPPAAEPPADAPKP